MFEDKDLEQMKRVVEEAPISDQISKQIRIGINRGRQKRKSMKRRMFASIAVSFMFITMFISIRVSPVFASYVSQIPGLEKIVQLINYDKGLKLAVENEFMQYIGASDEHEGIKLTIDGIIIDESQMVVFYTLENGSEYKEVNISDTKLFGKTGEPLQVGIGRDYHRSEENQKVDSFQEKIVITFQEGEEIPDTILLESKMAIGNYLPHPEQQQLESIWKINIPIDKSKFEGLKEVYTLNKEIEVEDQKITFKTVTVHPTKIAVVVAYDEQNSKELFFFDDLMIVDETGEELTRPNGVIARHIDKNTDILYLQSNYFKKPKELYLKFTSIQALDKDKLEIVVDLNDKKLLKKPDDQIRLYDIRRNGEERQLIFFLKKDPLDNNQHYSIFSGEVTDVEGNKYYSREQGFSQNEENYEIYLKLPNEAYKGPISLKISDYPTRIQGDIKIQVK